MVKLAAAALTIAVTLFSHVAGGSEIMLLDFASPHCPPCRQMDPLIQSFVAAGYPIRKVDVTQEPSLAHQYNVTRVPCFVMLADGQEVDRVVGATSQERIQSMFRRGQDELKRLAERRRNLSPDSPITPLPHGADPWQSGPAVAGAQTSGSQSSATQAGGTSASAPDPLSPLDARLLSYSVRLRVEDGQGRSFGTGTIIDARQGEALVITCGHIFRETKGKGPVTVELFEPTASGVRPAGQFTGQVISYDLDRDIGLVSIRPDRAVAVAPVAPTGCPLERGDRVTSVGCSNGADPTVMSTRITSLGRYQGPPNIQAAGAPVEGRSGGGLFNEDGQLIGICYAADYEGNEGLYAALDSIQNELDKIGLSEIYGKPGNPAIEGASIAVQAAPASPAVARGQEPQTPVGALSDATSAIGANDNSTLSSKSLSSSEQAALEEILARAATSEVICIIRPKEAGAQSEVITLDQVSPEFVRALTAQRNSAANNAIR